MMPSPPNRVNSSLKPETHTNKIATSTVMQTVSSLWELVRQILGNQMLVAPIVAWMLAQIIKTAIDSLRRHKLNLKMIVNPGGMPSAHSALVAGLATATALSHGVDSPLFAMTVVLAMIVMYDAAGVRQAVDRQSEILTHILTHVPRTPDDLDRFLMGLVGHTRVQVVAGALLGIAVATLWY